MLGMASFVRAVPACARPSRGAGRGPELGVDRAGGFTAREADAPSSWPHASQTSRVAGSDSPHRGHVIRGSVMLEPECTPT